MKKIYCIMLKGNKFFHSESHIPALYATVRDAKSDCAWIDDEQNPEIIEVKVITTRRNK